MDDEAKILQLIRMKGPVLPAQINKQIGTNLLFASAMLSQLVDRKILRLSSAKIGGSPVYYLPGQEARLTLLYEYLHEKEKRAYDLLKDKKILRDNEQEPVIRVALREIKDFATPLEVRLNGNYEIFWKWMTLQDEQAEQIIKKLMGIDEEKKEVKEIAEVKETPEVKKESTQVKEEEPEVKEEQKEVVQKEPPQAKESPVEKPEQKKQEIKKPVPTPKKEEQKQLQEKTNKKVELPQDDGLFNTAKNYFKSNHIDILEVNVVRKNSEIDFVIDLPSNVGSLTYYCKLKGKKKINDGDLSSAYVQGQMKKMPILFLTTGDVTKKAEELLQKEFKTMFVRKI